MLVDDSAIVRKLLTQKLGAYKDIEIVGTAPDPYIARDKILKLKPDVLVLDVEMPKMDGITFLKKMMKYYPMPILIFSSLTPRSSKNALEALSSGAVDVVCKPGGSFSVGQACEQLAEKIRIASKATVKKQNTAQSLHQVSAAKVNTETTNKIIALGASTGGVRALTEVITSLPTNTPGTVVVQHMPKNFTTSFASRLNEQASVNIKEAQNNDSVIPGQVLIAPGGKHMLLKRSGARYYVSTVGGEPVHHQKPSVEILFNSVADSAGANSSGAILTGMGQDGARGLLNMRKAGAHTIAQNEETCTVYGMPKAAAELNAAEKILPLNKIADALIEMTNSNINSATTV